MRGWLLTLILLGGAGAVLWFPRTPRAEIDRAAQRLLDDHQVAGISLAVVHQHELQFLSSHGLRSANSPDRVDDETLFQAASLSKPVTAVLALKRVDQGELTLDEDVDLRSWRIPGGADAGVTLRHLLSHRAGLNAQDYAGYEPGAPLPTLLDILAGRAPAHSAPVTMTARPNTREAYSGANYAVVQQLLTDASGRPFADLAHAQLFVPLGMRRSTFEQPLPTAWGNNVACGHRHDSRPLPERWFVYPEMAAAGLWTTPMDLARLLMELNASWAGKPGAFLPQSLARDMFTAPGGARWGLGWMVSGGGDELVYCHIGGNRGYRCLMCGRPATGSAAVIMTNSDNGADLAAKLLDLIRRKYGW